MNKKMLSIIIVISTVILFFKPAEALKATNINTLDHKFNEECDSCYGFIVTIKEEGIIYPTSTQLSISNIVTDLLRMNLSVFWAASNFSALTRTTNNDSTQTRFFEKGAFIIPLTGNNITDAIIASIIHDYEYKNEIETFPPLDIYIILEPLSLDAYPLNYPRAAIKFGADTVIMDEFWYTDALRTGGFLDNQILTDQEIPLKLNNKDFNMIIWPGALFDLYLNRLLSSSGNIKVCDTVRNFVKNGGGFTGACYAAMTASSGEYIPINIIQSRLEKFPVIGFLGLISDTTIRLNAVGIDTIIITNLSNPVTFGLNKTQKTVHGTGPVFTGKFMDKRDQIIGVLQNIDVKLWRGKYADIFQKNSEEYLKNKIGKPIWVESKFGKGKTVVFGDHPEMFFPERHDRLLHNTFLYITSDNLTNIKLKTFVSFQKIISIYSTTDNITLPEYEKKFYDIWNLTSSLNQSCKKIDDLSSKVNNNINKLIQENVLDSKLAAIAGFYLDPYQPYIEKFLNALKKLEEIYSISNNIKSISSNVSKWETDTIKELENCTNYCKSIIDQFSIILEKSNKIIDQNKATNFFNLFQNLETSYKKGYNSLQRLESLTVKLYRATWYLYEAEQALNNPTNNKNNFSKNEFILGTHNTPITIYVDAKTPYGGNGSSKYPFRDIQDAIDVANNGDTVFVKTGIYYGHVRVCKSIKFLGEDKNNTILDGEKRPYHHIWLTVLNITISGFTIQNSAPIKTSCGLIGIESNNTIENNIFRNNCIGIGFFPKSSNNTIKNNYFINNNYMGLGIDEPTSKNDVITGNVFENNDLYGLYALNVKITIDNNTFTNDGVTITPSSEPLHIELANNTVNGKPIVFYKNENNFMISNNAGQIILSNCNNGIIYNINISNTDTSIYVSNSRNITIKNCDLSNNNIGVFSQSSNDIKISNNNMNNNICNGIWLYESDKNILLSNTLNRNNIGILISSSNKNKIESNQIENNTVGIYSNSKSKQNIITKNNFVDNYQNAYDIGKNKWKNNYWDDWKSLNKIFTRFIPYNIPPRKIFNIDWKPNINPYE